MKVFREKKWLLSLAGFLGIIILGSLFFWWSSFYKAKEGLVENSPTEVTSESVTTEDETSQEEDEELTPEEEQEVSETPEEARAREAYVVDVEICAEECETYRNNPEGLAYCQAVCGLSEEGTERPKPTSCEEAQETAKDICYRDKAVAEKNIEECEKIVDKNLRKSCQNRIAEEYFDQ